MSSASAIDDEVRGWLLGEVTCTILAVSHLPIRRDRLMPHLTLEYTDNLPALDARDVLLELNRTLVESGHFEEADIKSRAIKLDTFVVGTSSDRRAFVHVKLAVLSGRSPETKRALSESLLLALKTFGEPATGGEVQLCVEVLDIDRGSYAKAVS